MATPAQANSQLSSLRERGSDSERAWRQTQHTCTTTTTNIHNTNTILTKCRDLNNSQYSADIFWEYILRSA